MKTETGKAIAKLHRQVRAAQGRGSIEERAWLRGMYMSNRMGYTQESHPDDFIKLSRVFALGYSMGYKNGHKSKGARNARYLSNRR